jgi:Protein of unknown function (DUF3421)
MRTMTISAALSAGLMVSQAMADQGNWVTPSSTPVPRDAVVGARQHAFHFLPDFICRPKFGVKHPGILMPYLSKYCNIVSDGMAKSVETYEVLTPAWKSCVTVSGCNGTGVPVNATYQGGHGIAKFGTPAVPLYFCRADFMGGKHLGKVFPGSNGCAIPWGGTEHRFVTPYEVLVDLSPKLPVTRRLVSGAAIPLDALVGGQDGDGANLYICQAAYNGGLTPGKTRPEFNGCNIAWAGQEVTVPDYDVLVPLWTDPSKASYSFPVTLGANSYVCHQPLELNGQSIPIGPGESQRSSTSSCKAADISEGDPILPTSLLPPLAPYVVLSE